MKKVIILGGSRGIGKGISDCFKSLEDYDVKSLSSKDLDTSNIDQVINFVEDANDVDVLVLNTGGPPAKDFFDIQLSDFDKCHNQLFVSFCYMLQKMKIKKGGYVFLISSFNIKEPNPNLVLSNSYRIAFTSVLKSVSKILAKNNITCINIAPGPIKTDRLYSLVDDMETFENSLPLGRAGTIEELGTFVSSIVENNIKYLNGVTINFDGGSSNYVL